MRNSQLTLYHRLTAAQRPTNECLMFTHENIFTRKSIVYRYFLHLPFVTLNKTCPLYSRYILTST